MAGGIVKTSAGDHVPQGRPKALAPWGNGAKPVRGGSYPWRDVIEQRADLVHRGFEHVRDPFHRHLARTVATSRRVIDDDADRDVRQSPLPAPAIGEGGAGQCTANALAS